MAQETPSATPEALQQALECHAADLWVWGDVLFTDHKPPSWLTPVKAKGHEGMLGLNTFHLAQPLTVFGQKVSDVSFMEQWVVIELPRAEALSIVAERKMERAPTHATEQYFRFIDPANGPMIGAVATPDDALEAVLGDAPSAKPDSANKTLFVGCNYAKESKTDFLHMVSQADEMMKRQRESIRQLMGKP